jgi:methanogenic corrinoid protein MtbC1
MSLSSSQKKSEPETFLSLLTQEVIPRLVLLEQLEPHGPEAIAGVSSPLEGAQPLAPVGGAVRDQADALATLAAAGDLGSCRALVQAQLAAGLRTESLFLSLIQPAARLLGERWVADTASFTDVTIGLWALQGIFSEQVESFYTQARPEPNAPGLFLCSTPGSQHRLGLRMVAAFFTKAGWQVTVHESASESELLEAAAASGAALIGLSLSSEADMLVAPDLITRLRRVCRAMEPAVMIGGPGVKVFPNQARAAGADLITGDAPDAVEAAQHYFLNRDQHGSH